MRILLADILTFDGFFGAKFDILKPRWLLTETQPAKVSIEVPKIGSNTPSPTLKCKSTPVSAS